MKANELVKIINACAKGGVSSYKNGDVHITFNGFVIQTERDYPEMVESPERVVVKDPNFDLQTEMELDHQDMEDLMILDPAGYEEKLMNDQLQESESMEDNEIQ